MPLSPKVYLSQRQLKRRRYKKSSLPSPICLKAEQNFTKVLFLPCLPGRTKLIPKEKGAPP